MRRSWRLNERHYGALQGKDKAAVRAEFGDEQFMLWRRSYDVPPPPLADDDEYSQVSDARYADLLESVPRTECLKDVVDRMLPYWYDAIVPDLRLGRTVLVVAHGNSLRALVKHLDGLSDDAIVALEHPDRHPAALRPGRGHPAADRRRASTSTRTPPPQRSKRSRTRARSSDPPVSTIGGVLGAVVVAGVLALCARCPGAVSRHVAAPANGRAAIGRASAQAPTAGAAATSRCPRSSSRRSTRASSSSTRDDRVILLNPAARAMNLVDVDRLTFPDWSSSPTGRGRAAST